LRALGPRIVTAGQDFRNGLGRKALIAGVIAVRAMERQIEILTASQSTLIKIG